MDIDRVRYFHIFAQTGSLVAASEILHISQPALSKALKQLEYEIGIKLVEPDGRGLRLTMAGQAFKNATAHLLNEWLNVPKNLKSGEIKAPIRIGSFEVFTTYFLAHLIKFVELHALELHEYGPGQLEDSIANGNVDIGITYIPIPKVGIEFVEATKIKMGVFGLRNFKNYSWDEMPFVVPLTPIRGAPSKVMGLDGWPDHKYQRKIKYRVTMMESAMQLCRSGQCVAYLPEFVVELHNQSVLPEHRLIEHSSPVLQKDRTQSVFLIRRKQTYEESLHRQIAKCLRSIK
jgi:DNA-binding transcriptional LysR family regulator